MSDLLNDFLAHLATTKDWVGVCERGTIESSDGEDFSHIATLYNYNYIPQAEIELALSEYLDEIGAYDSCAHSHDCCGCAVLKRVTFINEYPNDAGNPFLIYKESYGINI